MPTNEALRLWHDQAHDELRPWFSLSGNRIIFRVSMHIPTLCFIVISVAVALVSARSRSESYLAHPFRGLAGAPYKRQDTGVPSTCTSICDPVNNEVNSGCPVTACCTQSFETSYYNCLLCVGTADSVTDYSQAQTDLDALYVSCYNLGYQLQELTLPGQNPSRTLSTSTSFGTSSATSTSTSMASGVPSSSKTIINPSTTASHSSTSLATTTSNSITASSTPTFVSAAMNVGSGERGIWTLAAAAAVGLVIL